MSLNKIFKTLDIEMDKRLYQLKQKELVRLLGELIKKKNKKNLSKLISDNKYFNPNDVIKTLEKSDKSLLFKIFLEPLKEEDMRQPVKNWLKDEWEYPHIDYEVKIPQTRRTIDVVGCEYKRYAGIIGSNRIVAIELKNKSSTSAIDSAFFQAKDYVDCSDRSYVAVTPHVFLKYYEILLDKVEKYENEIGLLLVDKNRVITEVEEAEKTSFDEDKYDKILDYFKKK